MKKKTIASLIGLLLSTSAYSATTMISADDVLVSANRIERKDSDATYSSEIHSSDRIKSSGATSLYDYLSQQSSLNILPNYGNKATPSIDMRGYGIENGYQNIVVNVDGRRINNIDQVPPLLGSISLNNIEKIEIVKGAGSVIYGDGATAGVINIYTKSKTGVTIGSSFGNFGTRSSYINAGLSEKYFDISANASNESHDGFSKRDNTGKRDSFDNDTQNIKIKIKPTEKFRFLLDATSSRLNIFNINPISLEAFNNNPRNVRGKHTEQVSKTDQWQIGFEFDISDALSINAFHSFENKLNDINNRQFNFLYQPKYDYTNNEINLKYKGEDLFVVFGMQQFHGVRKLDADKTSKKNESYFIHTEYQPNWLLSDATISLGARTEKVKYGYSPVSSTNLTSNDSLNAFDIGFNYKLNQQASFFANYNQGYQAPDIDRFFYFDGASVNFNGFINPTKTKTFNVGVNHNTEINRLKLSLFRTNLRNEIFYYNTGDWLSSRNTNIDSSHKYGFELQDAWKINHLLNANIIYTYVRAIIDRDNDLGMSAKGNELPGVPKQTLSLNLNYKYSDNGNININHIWRDSAYAMNDIGNNFIQEQPKFESTNILVNYRLDRYEIFTSVSNVFAKENRLQVEDNNGIYPTDFARVWRLGLKADF